MSVAVRGTSMRVWPGKPRPLGATWDGEGVNFALFSEHATAVELCLFDGPDAPVHPFLACRTVWARGEDVDQGQPARSALPRRSA